MLTIKNLKNIEGNEFELSSGQKYIIDIVRAYYDHYSFGVFPILESDVPSIKDAIVYRLDRTKRNRRGYEMKSAKLKQNVYVKPANLTLKNFILELHIQTAQIC